MNKIFIFLLFYSNFLFANQEIQFAQKSYYEILQEEALFARKNRYNYFKNEEMISGGIALLIGTVGFYTTNSDILKFSYSLIQSIGTINIGNGYFKTNSLNIDESFYLMSRSVTKKNISETDLSNYIAKNYLHIMAKKEKAKRKSLIITSSILTAQYFSSAISSDSDSNLKKIYFYLTGVNAIILSYNLFFKSKHESILENKKKISYSPIIFNKKNQTIIGLNFSYLY